ncbi:MAG: 6-pyruvoyl trahydropterin synthase family protein [Gemmatimonadales bacterium]
MKPAARCTLTRAVSFHARHRFAGGRQGVDHGHLYRVECTVGRTGPVADPAVIDLDMLDDILTEEVTSPLGGRHLNEVIAEFASGELAPTCEALAAWCWERVAPRLPPDVAVVRMRVAEDDTLWADCIGID